MKIIYYCPKCKSTNVAVVKKEYDPVRKPMNKMPNPGNVPHQFDEVELVPDEYLAQCKSCGYCLPLDS